MPLWLVLNGTFMNFGKGNSRQSLYAFGSKSRSERLRNYLCAIIPRMISYIRFLFSKEGIKHLVMAGACLLILFFLLFAWMSSYTNHGEQQMVPDLTGMTLGEAKTLLDDQDLRYEVEDSLYVPDAVPGTIQAQSPEATLLDPKSGETMARMVKENRLIYLTVASSLPPKVELPDLVGMSKRSAINLLSIIGIEIDQIEYVPDEVCTDCVLKQTYKGANLKPGTRLFKGEKVSLVLGKQNTTYVSVPKIEGFTMGDAKNILNRVSLNMGIILGGCDDCLSSSDTLSAFILRQEPGFGNSVNTGTGVDVYLTRDASLLDENFE